MTYQVNIWQERDRAAIVVYNENTGEDIFELWDEEVAEFIEDGFMRNMRDIEGLRQYLVEMGYIDSNDKLMKESRKSKKPSLKASIKRKKTMRKEKTNRKESKSEDEMIEITQPTYVESENGGLVLEPGDKVRIREASYGESVKKNSRRKKEAITKDDTISAIKRALRADLEVEDVEFLGGDEYEGFMFGGDGASNRETEWVIFTDDDMARQAAINRVKEDIENEPEIFNISFLEQHLYISDADRRMIAIDESTDRVDEMDTEEILNKADMADQYEELQEEYDELEDQLSDLDSSEEDGAEDKRINIESSQNDIVKEQEGILIRAREDVQSEVYDEIYSALEYPIDYFVNELGDYSSVEDLINQSFIQIDVEQAAMEAVNTDGVAHFLDVYDGEEEEITDPETNETFFAYGAN